MHRLRLLALTALSLTLTFCTKKSGQLEYGLNIKDTIRINLSTEPPTLDWNKATDTTSALVLDNIMDGLVAYNYNDPELGTIPALASEWKASKDAKTWTFTLRKDVKWTDGTPFAAQQVVDGWERLLNPATASQYAYFLFSLKNAKAYNEGKIKDFSKVGVKINDQGQLVVELNQAESYFPYLLTHESTYPVRKDLIQKYGDSWTDPTHIQTLGAYKLKTWDHDKAIVLVRNDGYYGEKAKIKNVIGYMINDYSTALNLFESGRLDFQSSVPYNEIPSLKKNPGFRQTGILGIYYYGFNTRKPPMDNIKVRKAIVHAIDRKQITDLLAAGMAPLSSWIPEGMFGYKADIGLKFDPELARKLLDEAGYKDRSKFPKLTLGFNSNDNHQRIAENVQAQLKKNLGIRVELQNEEWKVFLSDLQTNPPSIFRMGWQADYPDPDNFMNLMTSYSDNNYTGWKSKKYDHLIEEGASRLDKEKRRELYDRAQKLLTETDVPVFPIYSMVAHILISKRLQNFPVNSMGKFPLKGVTFQ